MNTRTETSRVPNDLMTLKDIAEMNHCGLRHARDVIVKLPGFPAEAPTSTPRIRLWVRKEVRAYINRKPTAQPPERPAGHQVQHA